MHFQAHELAALIAVVSFAAGLNVYATVASLGLLGRFGGLDLPPSLHDLTSWTVIIIAGVLFAIEFFADKIPAFQVIWNAIHTFVRIPVAALLAFQATAGLPLWEQALATAAGSLIAFVAHGGKMATRLAVAPAPVPFKNAGVSLSEDAFVVFLLWLVSVHPYAAATIVLAITVFLIVCIRWVFCTLRNLFQRGRRVAVPA